MESKRDHNKEIERENGYRYFLHRVYISFVIMVNVYKFESKLELRLIA